MTKDEAIKKVEEILGNDFRTFNHWDGNSIGNTYFETTEINQAQLAELSEIFGTFRISGYDADKGYFFIDFDRKGD